MIAPQFKKLSPRVRSRRIARRNYEETLHATKPTRYVTDLVSVWLVLIRIF